MNLIVAISGASGIQYGLKTIEILTKLGHTVDFVISDGAKRVMEVEIDYDYDKILSLPSNTYDNKDIGAKIASGTNKTDGMIISPCSTKTLSAIANGFSENLIQRAAECMLKEGKKLVLVLRETPLSLIHLRNMVLAKEAGAIIMPASPGFYYKPKTVNDLINFIVGKTLNIFNIEHDLFKPWDPKNISKK